MKWCAGCKKKLPLYEFHKDSSRKDGYSNRCKTCKRDYKRKYYVANRDTQIALASKWNVMNRERVIQNKRRYYKKNRARLNAIDRSRSADRAYSQREGRKLLSNWYIRQLITETSNLDVKEIPMDLIELKRIHLKIKRNLLEKTT